jgi:hypothetical protein
MIFDRAGHYLDHASPVAANPTAAVQPGTEKARKQDKKKRGATRRESSHKHSQIILSPAADSVPLVVVVALLGSELASGFLGFADLPFPFERHVPIS